VFVIDPEEPAQLFVALYNYDPATMSPNPNCDEELSFTQGDLIYIHGEMDEDQFYFGELESGASGMVPSIFVKKVHENGQ